VTVANISTATRWFCAAVLFAASLVAGASASAAQSATVAEFYRDKPVYMVIGAAPGAGYDAYARLVARHLGKHIPGNPNVIPQTLDGAGGYRAAMRVARVAAPDGTSIAAIHPTSLLDPIMGDPRKSVERLDLAYLGSAGKDLAACFARADAPVKSFSELFERELVVGAGNEASTTREYSAILKNVLGAKLKISAGYSGNAQIYLAIDRGEVQGMCGTGYVGVAAMRPNWIKDGFIRVLAQESIHGQPDLNTMGVPLTLEFAKTQEQRQILEAYYSPQEFGRPFVVSAKVPRDRLQALQTAFMDTLRDPELLREAKAAKLEIDPLSASEVGALVDKAYATPPQVLAKLRQALGYGR
jgi:tripartite-type tricarboxylate transporter receptor subunit TctC